MSQNERTFIMVKADGVHRGLVGETIKRFEQKGLKLVGMKFFIPSEKILREHYSDLAGKPFFENLIRNGASGPAACLVFEGLKAVHYGRAIVGATDPAKAEMGTIRADFAINIARNIVHASDSPEHATKEIALWFKPEYLVNWTQCTEKWIYE